MTSRAPALNSSGETMTKLIGSDGEYYRIVAAHDRDADEPAVEFLDERDALQFLTELAADEFNQAAIRRFAAEDGLVIDPHAIGDQRLPNRSNDVVNREEGTALQRFLRGLAALAVDAVERAGLEGDDVDAERKAKAAAGNGAVDEAVFHQGIPNT